MRALLLAAAGVSLYLLFPTLIETFSSWPQLRSLSPWWLLGGIGFEAASFVALWSLQRVALHTRSWYAVATSQLAANAAGQVIPGGGAAATGIQYRLLVRAGVQPAAIVAGLTASWAATTVTALALPAVALVTAIGSPAVPSGLARVAYVAGAGFVLLVAVGFVGYRWDRPLRLAGELVRRVASRVGLGGRVADLPERLLAQRDRIGHVFVRRPLLSLLSAVGKWGFDYCVLLCALVAAGARPQPGAVLLAYAAAILLAMIPVTPGGLGFVELGLVGTLTLAGVGAATAAAATLAYRLVSYWLPLPVGLGAYLLARSHSSTSAGATSDAASSPP